MKEDSIKLKVLFENDDLLVLHNGDDKIFIQNKNSEACVSIAAWALGMLEVTSNNLMSLSSTGNGAPSLLVSGNGQ